MKFYTAIDLTLLPPQNLVLEAIGANPGAVEGRIYYNSIAHAIRFYDGTDWVTLGEGGGGSGTVTSVGLSMPTADMLVSGSPVTVSGTLTAAWKTKAANAVFAGPETGADATPAFRSLVEDDIPSGIARLTDIPAALPPNGSAGGDLSGTYPDPTVAKLQGRAFADTAPSDGEGIVWSEANTRWEPGAVGGGGGGTVTSVALTMPAIYGVAGSPITTSGSLDVTLATQAANLVWAGPATGADAAPAFRALVAADLPNTAVTPNTYGTAGMVGTFTVDAQGRITSASNTAILIAGSQIQSGWVPVSRGGTGTDLSLSGGANQIVRQSSVGGDFSVSALAADDIPNLDTAKLTSGTLPTTRGGTGVANSVANTLTLSTAVTLSSFYSEASAYLDIATSGVPVVAGASYGDGRVLFGTSAYPQGEGDANLNWIGSTASLLIGVTEASANVERLRIVQETSALGSQVMGVLVETTFNAAGTKTSSTRGIGFYTYIDGSGGGSGDGIGVIGEAQMRQTSGTLGSLTGANFAARVTGAGSVTYGYGARTVAVLSSSGNLTYWYGFQARSPVLSSTGAINTAYGLYIERQKLASGVTTGVGIYQADANDINYFAGSIGVGVSPSAPLHVKAAGEGLRIQGTADDVASVAYLTFYDSGGTRRGYVGDASASNYDIYVQADSGQVVLSTAGTIRMTVGASGANVGIGVAPSTSHTLYLSSGSNVAVRVDGAGNTATTATAGAAGDVPAQVVGYLIVNIAGTSRKIPYYAA